MEDVEQTPLLNRLEVQPSASGRGRTLVTGIGLLSAFLVGALMVKQPGQILKAEQKLWDADATADGWYIYKVAYAGRNGTADDLLKFMSEHSGGTDCSAVDLGCSGYKLTCNYGLKQLHYVIAPTLPDEAVDHDQLGTDGWIDIAMTSFGDMSTWSALMHDKVQLWTTSVRTKAEQLEAAGYPVMKRLSTATDGVTSIGHVLVPVEGKIWEFVGQLEAVDAKAAGFEAWALEECPTAHQIEATNIPALETSVRDTTDATTWIAVSTSISSSIDDESLSKYKSTLTDLTGATHSSYKDEYCEVKSFNYYNKWEESEGGSTGQNVFFKLVNNKHYQDIVVSGVRGGMDVKTSVDAYQNYVGKVHQRFLALPADGEDEHRWRGWDHFLDQHIGIKYSGSSAVSSTDTEEATSMQDLCLVQAGKLNAKFLDEKTLVGKRFIQTDGDHYYTGYSSSSMALEFNTECHYGAEGATDICTCIPQNSDTLAIETYGATFSTCDTIYTEQDGHTDLSGPWDTDEGGGVQPTATGPSPGDADASSSSSSDPPETPPETPPTGEAPTTGGTAGAATRSGYDQFNPAKLTKLAA